MAAFHYTSRLASHQSSEILMMKMPASVLQRRVIRRAAGLQLFGPRFF
jgi:hypothetical protein